MKLKFINIISITLASITSAQVGINSTTPNAAFDVEVNKELPVDKDIVGVKIPIISKQELGNKTVYGQNQKGTMVFVNDLTYTGNNSAVDNVEDNKYFYIFNGTTWKSSVYTLSASNFIITSKNTQGFNNIETEQPIILYQNGDEIIPVGSNLFTKGINGDYLQATEDGLYAISGFFFFRPRTVAGSSDDDTQTVVKLSLEKQEANSSNWTTISSISKYFFATTNFLGSTINIPENILSLNENDRIRFTISIPNQINSVNYTGFKSSDKNIGTLTFSGSLGSGHVVQNISRSLSIQKL